MNDLAKLTITKDSFIYSVNQAYEARIQNDGSFNSHLKYEPFLEKSWSIPKNPDINTLKKILSEIVEHHFTKLPNYRREEKVDIENISWFSHSFAALFADIEYLLIAYTSHGFPILSTPIIPRTNSSKSIIAAIKKYSCFKDDSTNTEKFSLFPLVGEDNDNLDDTYTQEIWSLIFYYIKKYFGSYAELASLYVTWKYLKKVDTSDIVDWNVRPPCGDLYRKQFKHLFEKDYVKNNSKKDNFNNKKSFNKPDNNKNAAIDEKSAEEFTNTSPKPTHPLDSAQDRITSTSKNFRDKPQRSNKFNDDTRRVNRPFKEQEHRERPPRLTKEEYQQNQEEIIAKAILEVELAIKNMQKNVDLQEVSLSPQNSFIRRQQHVVISENGFETESRGEDSNRYVCIKRK